MKDYTKEIRVKITINSKGKKSFKITRYLDGVLHESYRYEKQKIALMWIVSLFLRYQPQRNPLRLDKLAH
jgi:hypothetical protein